MGNVVAHIKVPEMRIQNLLLLCSNSCSCFLATVESYFICFFKYSAGQVFFGCAAMGFFSLLDVLVVGLCLARIMLFSITFLG